MNTIYQNKGITLIALVITIIILLLLAGISISALTENGIFGKVQEAQKTHENGINLENQILNQYEAILAEYLKGDDSPVPPPQTPEEPMHTGLSSLKAGDYVNYDTGSKGILPFRVLYDSTSSYGIQIISDSSVDNVQLGSTNWDTSMESINNAKLTLNKFAEDNYLNGNYALDARCVGSHPNISNGKFDYKNVSGALSIILPENWATPSGWTSKDTGCEYGSMQWSEIDYNAMSSLNIQNIDSEYWMAEQIVCSITDFAYMFGVRSVSSSGILLANACEIMNIVYNDSRIESSPFTFGFRPCILLRNDLNIISGNGTSESPYVIR